MTGNIYVTFLCQGHEPMISSADSVCVIGKKRKKNTLQSAESSRSIDRGAETEIWSVRSSGFLPANVLRGREVAKDPMSHSLNSSCNMVATAEDEGVDGSLVERLFTSCRAEQLLLIFVHSTFPSSSSSSSLRSWIETGICARQGPLIFFWFFYGLPEQLGKIHFQRLFSSFILFLIFLRKTWFFSLFFFLLETLTPFHLFSKGHTAEYFITYWLCFFFFRLFAALQLWFLHTAIIASIFSERSLHLEAELNEKNVPLLLPVRPLHNIRALKSVERRFRTTLSFLFPDFEARKLWNVWSFLISEYISSNIILSWLNAA